MPDRTTTLTSLDLTNLEAGLESQMIDMLKLASLINFQPEHLTRELAYRTGLGVAYDAVCGQRGTYRCWKFGCKTCWPNIRTCSKASGSTSLSWYIIWRSGDGVKVYFLPWCCGGWPVHPRHPGCFPSFPLPTPLPVVSSHAHDKHCKHPTIVRTSSPHVRFNHTAHKHEDQGSDRLTPFHARPCLM